VVGVAGAQCIANEADVACVRGGDIDGDVGEVCDACNNGVHVDAAHNANV
jgi:hypothetical protein